MVEINYTVQEPIEHLMNFVHKKWSPAELRDAGGAVARLTCGKAKEIASDFNNLLHDDILTQLVQESWGPSGWELDDVQQTKNLMGFYILQVITASCGFHRRIEVPAQRCPALALAVPM
jgi:hypothetical protein